MANIISGIRRLYAQQKKAAEERAKRRMAQAKSGYERERIKAELESEKLKLQRQMYEAKASVLRGKEAVAKAKREAGVVGAGERLGGAIKTGRRLLFGKPRQSRRKKTTKKRR